MKTIAVAGGKRLSGEIRIPGAKNTVLPVLAATLISGKTSVIHDCPQISDVALTLDILRELGCSVKREGNTVIVDSSGFDCSLLTEDWMHQMRSSIIFTGAILARCGNVRTCYPGGCELGLRPIDLHIKAFRQMGIRVKEEHGCILCEAEHPRACDILLDFPSVGATENVMLAAVSIPGTTRILNGAKEPEIEDLQHFLNSMGASVCGAGSGVIEITGTTRFQDTEYRVIPDRIVAATYMAGAAITGGRVELTNVRTAHLDAVLSALESMGADIRITGKDSLLVSAGNRLRAVPVLRTTPYPGFPTDAQSVFITLCAAAEGTGIVIESIFDSRFRHVEELRKMGADITVDGRMAVIRGVRRLEGTRLSAPDLRSGAALVIAGLAAEGITTVEGICHIQRGYEDIVRDLASLGAEIKRMDEVCQPRQSR